LGAKALVDFGDGQFDARQVEGAFRPVGEGEAAGEHAGGDGEAAAHGHVYAGVGLDAVGGVMELFVVKGEPDSGELGPVAGVEDGGSFHLVGAVRGQGERFS